MKGSTKETSLGRRLDVLSKTFLRNPYEDLFGVDVFNDSLNRFHVF